MGPERKSMVLREEERRATAYHEADMQLLLRFYRVLTLCIR